MNGFGINESEQQYVHMKSQPKMRNMQIAMWDEINGQRRFPSGKRF